MGPITVLFIFPIMIFGFPFFIYKMIKGLMTHNAELKYKYSQQNQQSEEKPEE